NKHAARTAGHTPNARPAPRRLAPVPSEGVPSDTGEGQSPFGSAAFARLARGCRPRQWHRTIGYRRRSREEQPAEYPNESRPFSSQMPCPPVTPAEASRGRLVSSSVIHFSALSKPPCRRRRYTASLRLTSPLQGNRGNRLRNRTGWRFSVHRLCPKSRISRP